MVPHPETLCRLCDLEFEAMLRDAAQERLVANAQLGTRSQPRQPWLARQAAVAWLGGWVRRARGTNRVRVGTPLAGPAHHVA